MTISARALAEYLHGDIEGDGGVQVANVASSDRAGASDVTFADNDSSCAEAFASGAGVVLVRRGGPPHTKTLIRVDNCREAFARAMGVLCPPAQHLAGVDASARISAGVVLGPDVHIGANVVLKTGVRVGARSVVLANCVLGEETTLGEDCVLHPNVTLYSRVFLGARVIVHAGAVIGSDGFGYARTAAGAVKIPQVGNVVIEDDVELGANVTIDRAMLNSTIIGRGTKIDNQVQIAHNVVIGRHCLIAGQSGIGGSARLGDRVTLAGRVAVVDHVEIGADAVVGAASLVTKDVPPGEVVWGTPARRAREAKRETVALRHLPRLLKSLHSGAATPVNGQRKPAFTSAAA